MSNAIYLDVFFICLVLLFVFSLGYWHKHHSDEIHQMKRSASYNLAVQATASLFFIIMFVLLGVAGLTSWRLMEVFVHLQCYGVSAWALTVIWFFTVTLNAGLSLYYKLVLLALKKIEA